MWGDEAAERHEMDQPSEPLAVDGTPRRSTQRSATEALEVVVERMGKAHPSATLRVEYFAQKGHEGNHWFTRFAADDGVIKHGKGTTFVEAVARLLAQLESGS